MGYIIETKKNTIYGEVRGQTFIIASNEKLEGFDLIELYHNQLPELKKLIKDIEKHLLEASNEQ